MKRVLATLALIGAAALVAAENGPPGPLQASGYVAQGFDTHGLDDVNLFNGNLIVNIPIGPVYKVGPNLSYQVKLTYNSKLWDQVRIGTRVCAADGGDNGRKWEATVLKSPGDYGIGWDFQLGSIRRDEFQEAPFICDASQRADETVTSFRDASGAEHRLYCDPYSKNGGCDADAVRYYSHDGSFLRVTGLDASNNLASAVANVVSWKVEQPDGTILLCSHRVTGFERDYSQTPANLLGFDGQVRRDAWYVKKIRDAFYTTSGNEISIEYESSNASAYPTQHPWRIKSISDSVTTRTVTFTYTATGATVSLPMQPNVANGLVTLSTKAATVPRQYNFTPLVAWSNSPTQLSVRELDYIEFPTGERYVFNYDDGSGVLKGALTGIGLPTGGAIDYTYDSIDWTPEFESDSVMVEFARATHQYYQMDLFTPWFTTTEVVASRTERRAVVLSGSQSLAAGQAVHDDVAYATTTYQRTMGGDTEPLPYSATLVTRPANAAGIVRQELTYFGTIPKLFENNTKYNLSKHYLRWRSDDGLLGNYSYEFGTKIREESYESPVTIGDGSFAGLNGNCGAMEAGDLPIPNLLDHLRHYPNPLDTRRFAADAFPNEDTTTPIIPLGGTTVESYGTPRTRPAGLQLASSYFYAYDGTRPFPVDYETNQAPVISLHQYYAPDVNGKSTLVSGVEERKWQENAYLCTGGCHGPGYSAFPDYTGFGGFRFHIERTFPDSSVGAETRTQITDFQTIDQYQAKWILNLPYAVRHNLYVAGKRDESWKELFDYDPSSGFLNSHWTYTTITTNGGNAGSKVVKTVRTRQSPLTSGLVASETVSSEGEDVNSSYVTTNEYSCGILKKATRSGINELNSAIDVNSVDVDVDCKTGLVTKSRGLNGLSSTFAYDAIGRLLTYTSGLYPESPSKAPPADAPIGMTYSLPARLSVHPDLAFSAFPLANAAGYVMQDQGARHEQVWFDGFGRGTRLDRTVAGPGTATSTQTATIIVTNDDLGEPYIVTHTLDTSMIPPGKAGLRQLKEAETCGKMRDPNAATATVFPGVCQYKDTFGRHLKTLNSDGSVSTTGHQYSAAEFAIALSSTCGVGGSTATSWTTTDARGLIRKVRQAPSARLSILGEPNLNSSVYETKYEYDVNGKLVQVAQGLRDAPSAQVQVRNFSYDSLGRLVYRKEPERTQPLPEHTLIERLVYDALGNPLRRWDETEQSPAVIKRAFGYTYDGAGRLRAVSHGESYATTRFDIQEIAYGKDGSTDKDFRRNQITRTSQFDPTFASAGRGPEVKETFTYKERNGRPDRAELEINSPALLDTDSGASFYRTLTYDILGNVDARRFGKRENGSDLAVRRTESMTYAATDPTGMNVLIGGSVRTVGFASAFWPNGQPAYVSLSGVLAATWEMNLGTLLPRTENIKYSWNGASREFDGFKYDGAGNITEVGEIATSGENRKSTYTYDLLSRLSSATLAQGKVETYTYDEMHNVASMNGIAMQYDTKANRLKTNAGDVAVYDDFGNMTQWGEYSYSWNAFDRQRLFEHRKDDGTVAERWAYLYTTSGERAAKIRVTTTASDPTRANRLEISVRDEGNRLATTWAAKTKGAIVSAESDYFNLWGRPLGSYAECAGNWEAYGTDHLGTPRVACTEGTPPKCVEHNYLPYGQEMAELPSGRPEDIKFTGHELDEESGSFYAHARYYSSAVGRFMSVDPKGGDPANPQSWNRYSYVQGNPIKMTDPTGEATFLVLYGEGELGPQYRGMHGDQGEQFQQAANTRAGEIQQSAEFNAETDKVEVVPVSNSGDFVAAANTPWEGGQVKGLEVFSHSWSGGLNLGGEGSRGVFPSTLQQIDTGNFTADATATLWGCNAGAAPKDGGPSFAQSMANTLGIPVQARTGPGEFNKGGLGHPPMVSSNEKRGPMAWFVP